MDTQRIGSIARQAGALAAVIMGILTSGPILNDLPTGVSAVLVAVGGLVFGIEHHAAATSAQNGSGAPQTTPVVPTTTAATSTSPMNPSPIAAPTLPPTKA